MKLDENLPVSACAGLAALGHDVDTVIDEGLAGADDPTVWTAARTENRFLVTLDLDFSDVRRFQPGTHAGLMIVRVPDHLQPDIPKFLRGWFADPQAESWSRCLVVATPTKLRVRRP
ncbi:MAG TPA: DUF5615 family PIN-like protein [Nannocystaceae bacterium]|nr:DUF5615 family PIN-like protein [Nannocystaceae bacterium]